MIVVKTTTYTIELTKEFVLATKPVWLGQQRNFFASTKQFFLAKKTILLRQQNNFMGKKHFAESTKRPNK